MVDVKRIKVPHNSACTVAITALLVSVALILSEPVYGKKKKEDAAPAKPKPNVLEVLDYSKIVWPNPPAIARIRYVNYFAGEKYKPKPQEKKKASWKDRLAGVAAGAASAADEKPHFQLIKPYGMAVDSKNRLYVADGRVGAVFVVNTDTWEFDLIKNGVNARFGLISGLALDDSDRLFVSDSKLKRVLVLDPQHHVETSITEGLNVPAGLAVDNENRFLYVADTEADQVVVFDADPPFKLLRRIGTGGKDHRLTSPGDFSKPTSVAVDKDGNLYVTDTWNNRVEIFDADGRFIRTFGKVGDGPGYFARPKGIALDGDGHIWVADGMQDRVQVFTPDGRLLIWMGGHGTLPGQFSALVGVAIDKNNRVFTSEDYPGRVQMFRYVSDEEAKAEKERRDTELQKKSASVPANQAGKAPESAAK